MNKVTLYKITEVQESRIGSDSSKTEKILVYLDTKDKAKWYLKDNDLHWAGNITGSISYKITEEHFVKEDK